METFVSVPGFPLLFQACLLMTESVLQFPHVIGLFSFFCMVLISLIQSLLLILSVTADVELIQMIRKLWKEALDVFVGLS